MKKLLSVLLCAAMLAAMLVVSASAVTSTVTDDTWSSLDIKALFTENATTGEIYSDLAEDFYDDEWYRETLPDEYGLEEQVLCTNQTRGFAISPDGKFAFLGNLNGGTGFRGCAMFNLYTGKITDVYYKYDGNEANCNFGVGPFSYPKGIAVDDRGYVYVGFAFSNNYNVVKLGVAQADYEKETMTEVSCVDLCNFGTIGDTNGTRVGTNGVNVVHVGEKYYCYAVLNYVYDAVVCFDVTDPANPVLNKDFGKEGYLEFSAADCTVLPEGLKIDEAYNFAVDTDGSVYVCARFLNDAGEKSFGVMQINPNGTELQRTYMFETSDTAYSICIYGSYLIVGSKKAVNGIYVLDSGSFDLVKQVKLSEDYNKSITYVTVVNDILYIDHETDANECPDNTILVAPLTEKAAVMLEYQAAVINDPDHKMGDDDTDADTTAPDDGTGEVTTAPAGDVTTAADVSTADDVSTAVTTAAGTDADTTKAPAGTDADTTAAGTDKSEGSTAVTTAADTEKSGSGCGSVITSGAAILAVLTAFAGAAFVKRNKND